MQTTEPDGLTPANRYLITSDFGHEASRPNMGLKSYHVASQNVQEQTKRRFKELPLVGLRNTSPSPTLVPGRREYGQSNPILYREDQLLSNQRPLVSAKGRNDTISEEVMGKGPAFIAPILPMTGVIHLLSN